MKWDDESISSNDICGHITNTAKTADTRQKSQKGQLGLCDPVICSSFTDQDFVLLLKYLDVFKNVTIISNESSHPAPEKFWNIDYSLISKMQKCKFVQILKYFLLWKDLSKIVMSPP